MRQLTSREDGAQMCGLGQNILLHLIWTVSVGEAGAPGEELRVGGRGNRELCWVFEQRNYA